MVKAPDGEPDRRAQDDERGAGEDPLADQRGPEQAQEEKQHAPARQGQERREAGPVDVGSVEVGGREEGHGELVSGAYAVHPGGIRWAVADAAASAWVGASVALTVAAERRSPHSG